MVVVQLNDPDPLFWVSVYGSCALVPAIAFLHINNKPLFYISLVLCAIAISVSFGGVLEYTRHFSEESILQPMSADKLYLEETREFFGALIAVLLISAHQFILSKQNAK